MRILVAVEPIDFRCGIDGLSRRCREIFRLDPFSGMMFVFRNRRATAIKALVYDGQGFWLCHKRLSAGRYRWWPTSENGLRNLETHQLQVLLSGGDPLTKAMPMWRRIGQGE